MNNTLLTEVFSNFRNVMRQQFSYPDKKVTQWFPGHMNKGLKQMDAKLRSVDCVLEVHDARIPISGRNPKLASSFLAAKPYMLILNKADLIPNEYRSLIKSVLRDRESIENVVFTNAKQDTCPGLKSVIQTAVKLITCSDRFNRKDVKDYNVMVIGVPNVGKSSLINALRGVHMRKRHSLQVGPTAGVTKSVHEKMRVCMSPAVYLLDTPGIMNPNINGMDTGMRLAACASFKDHLVGEEVVADYLLYRMNKNGEFGYVSSLGLAEPCDNIHEILVRLAVKNNLRQRVRHLEGSYREIPDFKASAQTFVNHFRNGDFGRILLDKDLLESDSSLEL